MLPPVIKAVQALEKCGLQYDIFDNVRVEPTDSSFKECIEFARKLNPDAFLGKLFHCKAHIRNIIYPQPFM